MQLDICTTPMLATEVTGGHSLEEAGGWHHQPGLGNSEDTSFITGANSLHSKKNTPNMTDRSQIPMNIILRSFFNKKYIENLNNISPSSQLRKLSTLVMGACAYILGLAVVATSTLVKVGDTWNKSVF